MKKSVLSSKRYGSLAIAAGLMLTASFPANALTLDEALKAAYENNPSLNAEREGLKATDERVRQAVGGFLPTLEWGYSRGRTESDITGRAKSSRYGDTSTLSLEQPLFDGLSTVNRTKSARNTVMAARQGLVNTEQQTFIDAITSYYDSIRDQAVLELSKSNRDVLQKRLDMTRERFEVGELTKTDVAQSEARFASAVSNIAQANASYESSKASFKEVTGLDAEGLEPTAAMLGDAPESLEQALEIAAQTNPALRAAIYQEKAAKADYDASKGDILPSLALAASKQKQDNQSQFIAGTIDEERVALNLSVPIFQAGNEYSRMRQLKSTHERRKRDIDANRNAVVNDIIDAWERMVAARSSIDANKKAVEASELAVAGTQMEADLGTRTTLEVLDTQQDLFESKVNLVRSERDATVAYYTLLANMGQLTADKLSLDVKLYNPVKNYDKVKYQPLGW